MRIEKLTELFLKFPGIGPRQAKRFVYFLLRQPTAFTDALREEIALLKKETGVCPSCLRFFEKRGTEKECSTCSDSSRDKSLLMIVGTDIDFQNIEKSSHFKGRYFILGGMLSLLEKQPEKKIRIRELVETVANRLKEGGLKEIIFALNATPEGEETVMYLKNALSSFAKAGLKLSSLGRGLSTGFELEYSDGETIRNALSGRTSH
ncbi:MAG: toprim domain-containing protein [Patescibacteria group bacterium]